MKKILTLLCAAVLSATSYAGDFPDITVTEVKKAIDDKKVVLIDVNGSGSWKAGHVPGAIDFEASGKELASKLPKEKDALIVAYCGGPGCNAYKAGAEAAKKLGYTNVKHMAAGISGWKEAKQPLETGDAKKGSTTSATGGSFVAKVDGVVCASCEGKVAKAFTGLGASNVKFAKGDKEGQAVVTFNGTVAKDAAAKALGDFALVSLEAAK